MNEKRIDWIDYAKGIGIILVMFGHTYLDDKYVFWFTSFHMALFFFLSGCTFRFEPDTKKFLLAKCKSLLIPYVFFAIVATAYDLILGFLSGNCPHSLLDTFLSYVLQIRYTFLWFLPCLFLTELCFYGVYCLLKSKDRKWLYAVSVLCFALEFLYRCSVNINLIWNVDLVVLALGFMILGYTEKSQIPVYRLSVVCVCLPIYLAVVLTNYQLYGKVDWWGNQFGNPLLFLVSSIAGTWLICALANQISSKFIRELGKNSLMFYGLHRIVIDASFILYGKVNIHIVRGNWESIIWAAVSVVLSLAVIWPINLVIRKYFPWMIGRRKPLRSHNK